MPATVLSLFFVTLASLATSGAAQPGCPLYGGSQPTCPTGEEARDCIPCDLDDDGLEELAQSLAGSVDVCEEGPNGGPFTGLTHPVAYPSQCTPAVESMAAGDFDGDGESDDLSVNCFDPLTGEAQLLRILSAHTAGAAQSLVQLPGLYNPTCLAAERLDNSDQREWCLACCEGDPTIPGSGGAALVSPDDVVSTVSSGSGKVTSVQMADFDNDGNVDVALLVSRAVGSVMQILAGNGDGTLQAPVELQVGTNAQVAQLEVTALAGNGGVSWIAFAPNLFLNLTEAYFHVRQGGSGLADADYTTVVVPLPGYLVQSRVADVEGQSIPGVTKHLDMMVLLADGSMALFQCFDEQIGGFAGYELISPPSSAPRAFALLHLGSDNVFDLGVADAAGQNAVAIANRRAHALTYGSTTCAAWQGGTLRVAATPPYTGQVAPVQVQGAAPFGIAAVGVAAAAGALPLQVSPSCFWSLDPSQTICVKLLRADASGTATMVLNVPASAGGVVLHFQAAAFVTGGTHLGAMAISAAVRLETGC